MAGNAWEWVHDMYSFYYYSKSPQLNPQGPNIGDYRVLRGGSWFATSSNARSTFRAWMAPDGRELIHRISLCGSVHAFSLVLQVGGSF